jgi:hypothetical protein
VTGGKIKATPYGQTLGISEQHVAAWQECTGVHASFGPNQSAAPRTAGVTVGQKHRFLRNGVQIRPSYRRSRSLVHPHERKAPSTRENHLARSHAGRLRPQVPRGNLALGVPRRCYARKNRSRWLHKFPPEYLGSASKRPEAPQRHAHTCAPHRVRCGAALMTFAREYKSR